MPTPIYALIAIVVLAGCGGRDTNPATIPPAPEQPEPAEPVHADDGCKQAVQALVTHFYDFAGAIPPELLNHERMRELACTAPDELSCESLGITAEQCTRLESMADGMVDLTTAMAERCDIPPPEKPLFPLPPEQQEGRE